MNPEYVYLMLLALKHGPEVTDMIIELLESSAKEGKEITLDDIKALKAKIPDEEFIPSKE